VPGQHRPFDAEPVEKVHDVGGEVLHPIAEGWLVRVAVTAPGHRDDTDRRWELLEHRLVRTPRVRRAGGGNTSTGPASSPCAAYDNTMPLSSVTLETA
jgi:hypothetical protein